MSEATKEVKPHIIVTMADGSKKDFGERGKLLSSKTIDEDSFTTTFHVVTGEQVQYQFNGNKKLLLEMAEFGFSAKLKAAVTGTKSEHITAILVSKIEEINNGDFVSRNSGEPVSTLSQIQQAYAKVNDIDITDSAGLANVNAIFAAMSKEEKSALYKNPDIKYEVTAIQFEAARVAKELAKGSQE